MAVQAASDSGRSRRWRILTANVRYEMGGGLSSLSVEIAAA
jgi:hypothetical protein